jgi:two-component system chemotaxis response regulator CheB
MNILLLAPQDRYEESVQALSRSISEATFVTREEIGAGSEGSAQVDIILCQENPSNGSNAAELLLNWRTHPHTCLIPCWIGADPASFDKRCVWPRLGIDRFDARFDADLIHRWISEVTDWQQSRMLFPLIGSLSDHGVIEIISGLALRYATGRLQMFGEDESEGSLSFKEGRLVRGAAKHLRGEEAFFEFMTWSRGGYQWSPNAKSRTEEVDIPMDTLLREGLKLFQDANLLYHFLPDTRNVIARTESESALDDGAVPYYTALKQLYSLIDGSASAAEIMEASPLSRIRTMSCMVKWFSLGDIVNISQDRSTDHGEARIPKPHRLLIVDDSPFMCRAIQAVFSQDARFEIVGVAHNGYEALDLIRSEQPDVVTLDLIMPQMDGLTTLKNIMIRHPKPVVILSAFTEETSRLTYESFKFGAVDVFSKPSRGKLQDGAAEAEELRERLAQASMVRMEAAQYIRRRKATSQTEDGAASFSNRAGEPWDPRQPLILIYCGTGGFPLLLKLFLSFSEASRLPPIIACLAMPERVIAALLPNMEKDSGMQFQELVCGASLRQRTAYGFSHDHFHTIEREEDLIRLERPADEVGDNPFDRLLMSASDCLAGRVVAVAISGTGDDGVRGMRYVQENGGRTFALSPDICLKPELPRTLLDKGCAREVKGAAELAGLLEDWRELFAGAQ